MRMLGMGLTSAHTIVHGDRYSFARLDAAINCIVVDVRQMAMSQGALYLLCKLVSKVLQGNS
jgi:hypothetical protein